MTAVDRFVRQKDLVPERIQTIPITVVGCGAIGRQVAIMLGAMGSNNLILVDFDIVDETNRTTQGYLAADVGRPKVEALSLYLQAGLGVGVLETHNSSYTGKMSSPYMFCCVDSIETRKIIWETARQALFYCDGRMLGETIRVITATDKEHKDYYPKTLFKAAEAVSGSCTARSTIYAASCAAALMVQQFVQYLRGQYVNRDLILNLFAADLFTHDETAEVSECQAVVG